ncbi:hypothetical protein AGIG_G26394, partial [Arapaima gigas]
VEVYDQDGGKNGIVHCEVSNDLPFKLDRNYNNYYSLMVDGTLDRESTSQYNVTIIATDEGNPPLSSSTVITVQISDVNDNAPCFPEQELNVYLKENSPAGTLIQTVTAVDADANGNAQVTYSLLETNSKGIST